MPQEIDIIYTPDVTFGLTTIVSSS